MVQMFEDLAVFEDEAVGVNKTDVKIRQSVTGKVLPLRLNMLGLGRSSQNVATGRARQRAVVRATTGGEAVILSRDFLMS